MDKEKDVFIERVSSKFGNDTPFFTEDILKLFPDYSRMQVFRFIKKAKEKGEIVRFGMGTYFIPHLTFWGDTSTITADDVVEKRYLRNGDDVYGIYSGLKLLNAFSVTTQMAMVIEVITNHESTRKREIEINGRKFVLRKSRLEITADNYAAYMVLEMFNDLTDDNELENVSKERLVEFIKKKNVTKEQLFSMAAVFPAKAAKNLVKGGIIDAIA